MSNILHIIKDDHKPTDEYEDETRRENKMERENKGLRKSKKHNKEYFLEENKNKFSNSSQVDTNYDSSILSSAISIVTNTLMLKMNPNVTNMLIVEKLKYSEKSLNLGL